MTKKQIAVVAGSSVLLPCLLFMLVTTAGVTVSVIQTAMITLIAADVITFGIFALRAKDAAARAELILWAVLIAGLVMRLGYMLYTPAWVRGHDFGDMNISGRGHAAYLLTLLEEHQLPQSNRGQFYQQPLYYLIAAPLSRLLNTITGTVTSRSLLDGAKVVSCIASSLTLVLVIPMCKTLGIKKRGTCIAAAVVAFLPNFYLMGGRVGTDALAVFLMLLAFWFTAVWMEDHSWKNTVLLALIYGAAVSTKISCGTIALFTAVCMILVLRKESKTAAGMMPVFRKLIVFGCIALPIGMWYSVRNFIRFGQEFGYVLKISDSSDLYLGDRSLLRLVVPYLSEYMATPYADPWEDASLPVYLVKTALFGEFTYDVPSVIPVLLLNLNVILVVASIVCGLMLFFGKKGEKHPYLRYGVPAMWAVLYLSAVVFNITLPFGCSMDFRYFVPTAVFGALCLGSVYDDTEGAGIVKRLALPVLCTAFSVISIVMFCVI